MSLNFTESILEDVPLVWLGVLGYVVLHDWEIAVKEPGSERSELLTDWGYPQ